jgi:hypothetical protein
VPIPCGACRQPVHEHAVDCPHCGEATGVVANPKWTAEERAAAIELVQIEGDRYIPPERGGGPVHLYDPELAVLGLAAGAVVAVVKTAVEAVLDERRSQPAIPRAIARERTGPRPIEPVPSVEPEPAPPPSDKPRFLK